MNFQSESMERETYQSLLKESVFEIYEKRLVSLNGSMVPQHKAY